MEDGSIEVIFDTAQRSVSPGQSVGIYLPLQEAEENSYVFTSPVQREGQTMVVVGAAIIDAAITS